MSGAKINVLLDGLERNGRHRRSIAAEVVATNSRMVRGAEGEPAQEDKRCGWAASNQAGTLSIGVAPFQSVSVTIGLLLMRTA